MKEILYVINRTDMGRGVKITVIATVEKDFKTNTYTYKPYNLSFDSKPRAKKILITKELIPLIQRRLYSKNRPDIQEILAKYGLNHYDEWILLKRTRGRLLTDNILYLTRDELDALKLSPEILEFIDVNE